MGAQMSLKVKLSGLSTLKSILLHKDGIVKAAILMMIEAHQKLSSTNPVFSKLASPYSKKQKSFTKTLHLTLSTPNLGMEASKY
jgi:hypothetical protein